MRRTCHVQVDLWFYDTSYARVGKELATLPSAPEGCPIPYSPFPIPHSLFPTPHFLFPKLNSMGQPGNGISAGDNDRLGQRGPNQTGEHEISYHLPHLRFRPVPPQRLVGDHRRHRINH